MSGGSIAYHLRTSKNIERKLFLDLLSRIGRCVNISEYTYIGFGGPFAEDFKEIHNSLRINKMVSIEMDANVLARQKFNYPARFIEHFHGKSSEYIEKIDELSSSVIVWLDYTSVEDLNDQIKDFQQLIRKLSVNDVVKITLNAHPPSIATMAPENVKLSDHRIALFRRRTDTYCNWEVEKKDITEGNYPNTLLKVLKNSISGLSSRVGNAYFHPLAAYSYSDGMQMMTLTGIMLSSENKIDKNVFFNKTRLKHWPFSNLDWGRPLNISVPVLSAKERMAIDAELPIDQHTYPSMPPGVHLYRALGFAPTSLDKIDAGKLMLENYARFYRAYPTFLKTDI